MLALLFLLNFKFIWDISSAAVLALEIGITDKIVDTIFLSTFVEGVD